jgi:hypothetical protein
MPSNEDRLTALENDRKIARRENAALVELMAASFQGMHSELAAYDVEFGRLNQRFDKMDQRFENLEADVSAILSLLHKKFPPDT